MDREQIGDAPEGKQIFQLQCLGDLALYSGSHRVGEARRKPLAVLAVLAVEAPRAVNREALAALLWPDSSPEKARRALSQAIYALRKECGTSPIDGSTQLCLRTSVVSSDVAEFKSRFSAEDYRGAIAKYTGPFLDGFWFAGGSEFEKWCDTVRAKLALQHRDSLLACAEKAVSEGEEALATKLLTLAHDVYPEDALVAERLALHYLVVDAAHLAAGVIDVFERRLREELDIDLPDSLRTLRVQLHGKSRSTPTSASKSEEGDKRRHVDMADATPKSGVTSDMVPPSHDRGRQEVRKASMWGWRYLARASVMVGAVVAALSLVHTLNADDQVDTLWQQQLEIRKRDYEERAALVDSAAVGRILILPTSAASIAENVDTLLQVLDNSFYRQFGDSLPIALRRRFPPVPYTRVVPRSEVEALLTEAEQRRLPTTTTRDVAWLLKRSGAALAVQPSLRQYAADSFKIAVTYYRDYSHTRTAEPGAPGLETIVRWSAGPTWRSTVTIAQRNFRQFVLSMESCRLEQRVSVEASPWCWTKGKRLRVALSPEQATNLLRIRRDRGLVR